MATKTAEQRKTIDGFFTDWRKDWEGFFAEARERAHPKPAKRSEAAAKA